MTNDSPKNTMLSYLAIVDAHYSLAGVKKQTMKVFIEASEQFYIRKIYYLLRTKAKNQTFTLLLFCLKHILLFISALSNSEAHRADSSTYLYSILVKEGDFVDACKIASVIVNGLIMLYILGNFLRFYLKNTKHQGKNHKSLQATHETDEKVLLRTIMSGFRIILECYEPVLIILILHFSLNYNFARILGIFNACFTILIGILIVDCDYDYTSQKKLNCIARTYHSSQVGSLVNLAACVIFQSLWKAHCFLILFIYYLVETSIYMRFRMYSCMRMHRINIFTLAFCASTSVICECYSPSHATSRFSTVLILVMIPISVVISLQISSLQEKMKITEFLSYNEQGNFNQSQIAWQTIDSIMRTDLLATPNKSELERRQIVMLSLSIQYIMINDEKLNYLQSKQNVVKSNEESAFFKSDGQLYDMLNANLMNCYQKEISKAKQLTGKANNRQKDIGWFFSYFIFLIEKRNNLILYMMEADALRVNSCLTLKDKQILHTIDGYFMKEKKILDKIQTAMNPFSSTFINAIIFEESLSSIQTHLELSVTQKITLMDLLDERLIQSRQLMQIAFSLEEQNKLARKLLNQMGQINPESTELMRLQDMFIDLLAFSSRDVKFINRTHSQLLRRNNFQNYQGQSSKKINSALPTGCVVFAVSSKDNDWVVKKVSSSFSIIFGMHGKDIRNQSITNLMPSILREHHSKYIRDFLALDCSQVALAKHKDRVLYARDAKGYVLPVQLDVRVNQFEDTNGHFLGLAAELNVCDRETMVILYNRGTLAVNAYSEQLGGVLFYSSKEVKINKLFPFIVQLNNQEMQNDDDLVVNTHNQPLMMNKESRYVSGKNYPFVNGRIQHNYKMEYLLINLKLKKTQRREREESRELSSYQFLLAYIELQSPQHRYHRDLGVIKIYGLTKLKAGTDAHQIKQFIDDNQEYYENLLGGDSMKRILQELESQERYSNSHRSSVSEGLVDNRTSSSISSSDNSKFDLKLKTTENLTQQVEQSQKCRQQTITPTTRYLDSSLRPQSKLDLCTVKINDSQQNDNRLPPYQQSSLLSPAIDSLKQILTTECQIQSTADIIMNEKSCKTDNNKLENSQGQENQQVLPNQEKIKAWQNPSSKGTINLESATNRAVLQQLQVYPGGASPRYQSFGASATFGNEFDEEKTWQVNPAAGSNFYIDSARESIQSVTKQANPERQGISSMAGISAQSQQKFFESNLKRGGDNQLGGLSRREKDGNELNGNTNSCLNHLHATKVLAFNNSQYFLDKNDDLHAKNTPTQHPHNPSFNKEYTRIQDNMSTSSQGSTQTSAKKSLYSLVKNHKSSSAIRIINLFGFISFLVIFSLGIIQYVITTIAIEDNLLEWNEYDFPAVYQANLFNLMKDMNTLSLLNRTDNAYYFDITASHKTELVNEASAHSWVIKSQNAQMIAHMSHLGTQRRVFQLILNKPANYTIGQNYNMSILNQTSSVPSVLLGILYPTSLLYAITFSQYHTFRYAAQLANGRPEYFTIVNQLRLSGYLSEIYESIQEEKINEKDSISFQLNLTMSMVIIVSAMCVGIIAPLFAYVQILRDQVLSLFGTFTSSQLESVKSRLYRYLHSSTNRQTTLNTKISHSSLIQAPSALKERFLWKKQILHQSRHTISQVTKLPKYNLSLLLFITLVFAIVITSPIINQIITQDYFIQVVDDYQVSYKIQSVRSQILKLIGLDYYCMTLKLYPNSKPMKLSQFIDNATEVKNSNSDISSSISSLIESQSKITRYKQDEYDSFFFPILTEGIYDKLVEYPEYQRNQTSPIPMQQCSYVNQQYLSQGMQLGFQNYFSIFDQIYLLLNTTDTTQSSAILANLQKSLEIYDLTLTGKCLSDAAFSLSLFLKDIHQNYYDVIMVEQLVLLCAQVTLVTLIFIIGWNKLSSHLAKQIFQTQGYLQVLNINMLLDNTYVVSYVRTHHTD